MSEVIAQEAAAEAPVEAAEPQSMAEQGLAKGEILSRLFGETEYEADDSGAPIVEAAVAAPESPVEPPKPVEGVIPGSEAVKPAEPIVDDSEKDVASVADAPGAGKFRVRTEEGSFTETPAVKVEFQVGEKVYTKGVPELVRMAIDGVAGQRAVAQARQLESEVIPRLQGEAQTQIAQMRADLEAQIELNAAILADETGETWAKNHEKFAQARSPEQIARRAQEEANAARAALAESQQTQYVQHIHATQIKPVFDRVAAECPDVSDHTKAGFVADLTKDLLVNGRIPPERFAELVGRMNGPYVEMARAEQARHTQAKAALDAEVAKARAEAQAELRKAQAKQNELVAPIAPVGAVPGSAVQTPRPPAKTRREALERIIQGG